MKARRRLEIPTGLTEFDLTAPIVPKGGAGGVTFQNRLQDFEFLITEKFFNPKYRPDITIELDKEYLLLTLKVQRTALQIQFDIISGHINLITCGKGYQGALSHSLFIGAHTKGDFSLDTNSALTLICIGLADIPLMDWLFFRQAI